MPARGAGRPPHEAKSIKPVQALIASAEAAFGNDGARAETPLAAMSASELALERTELAAERTLMGADRSLYEVYAVRGFSLEVLPVGLLHRAPCPHTYSRVAST